MIDYRIFREPAQRLHGVIESSAIQHVMSRIKASLTKAVGPRYSPPPTFLMGRDRKLHEAASTSGVCPLSQRHPPRRVIQISP